MGTFLNPAVASRVPIARSLRQPEDIGRTLYYSDFLHDSDLEVLTVVSGTWAVEAGELSGQAGGGASAHTALRYTHDDILFEARIRDLDASGINYWRNALRIRLSAWNDPNAWEQWNFTEHDVGHALVKRVGGVWSVESSLAEAIAGWRLMTFMARGSDLRGIMDGALKVSDVDVDVPRGEGLILSLWADTNPEHAHINYMIIRRMD